MSCDTLKQLLDPLNEHTECFSNSTVAEENRKKFVINKPADIPVCKVQVDGCLITSQQVRKCDYFFEVGTIPKRYFLVELKGSDLSGAIEQLVSTYDHFSPKLGAKVSQYSAIVVSSVVPKANNDFRNRQQRLMKTMQLHLERGSIQHHVTFK